MRTLQKIKTPRGFVICPVHYSLDPKKGLEWRRKERAKYGIEGLGQGDWDREQEIDFRSQLGAPGYPAFSDLNLDPELYAYATLPLCLCCDFNVDPMGWEISQIVGRKVHFVDEIRLAPASIDEMVREFRNKFPAHPAEIWVYGDSLGRGRKPQTAQSDYDLILLAFQGYCSPLVFKVPDYNPGQKDRLNAFNAKLKGAAGEVEVLINPKKCPELVRDMREVYRDKTGKAIHKSNDRKHSYYQRTHYSDAGGYMIMREFPVVEKIYRSFTKPRQPLKYRRILGAI